MLLVASFSSLIHLARLVLQLPSALSADHVETELVACHPDPKHDKSDLNKVSSPGLNWLNWLNFLKINQILCRLYFMGMRALLLG
jgi:hypothetical protein